MTDIFTAASNADVLIISRYFDATCARPLSADGRRRRAGILDSGDGRADADFHARLFAGASPGAIDS